MITNQIVDRGQGRFNFRSFFKLINQVQPKYWQFIVGIIIGLVATGINLWVPKMAQKLINSYNGQLDKQLVAETIVLFIAGTLISAVSGLILGVFGEHNAEFADLHAAILRGPGNHDYDGLEDDRDYLYCGAGSLPRRHADHEDCRPDWLAAPGRVGPFLGRFDHDPGRNSPSEGF
ncbi:hypothetical protein FC31_GL000721 [Limosilactobacillus antri DSM 16041]|uniref:ABC transmembrane type-1 domain-containing protein n=1 Tax=Limosilactobacillus antri DSM 16041 TaxID=525309 RepID=A0ABR5P252_9LACO|nr:hypothetical protein FC31_GL000721 [Limosilactobacillus antri DSM 16041]